MLRPKFAFFVSLIVILFDRHLQAEVFIPFVQGVLFITMNFHLITASLSDFSCGGFLDFLSWIASFFREWFSKSFVLSLCSQVVRLFLHITTTKTQNLLSFLFCHSFVSLPLRLLLLFPVNFSHLSSLSVIHLQQSSQPYHNPGEKYPTQSTQTHPQFHLSAGLLSCYYS